MVSLHTLRPSGYVARPAAAAATRLPAACGPQAVQPTPATLARAGAGKWTSRPKSATGAAGNRRRPLSRPHRPG